MEELSEEYRKSLFAAGAYSVAAYHGMSENDAESFVRNICKHASIVKNAEDYDDDTWWGRNKGWIIPTALTVAAFMIGNDAGRNGRPDRSAVRNAWDLFSNRIKSMFYGSGKYPLFDEMTKRVPLSDVAPQNSDRGISLDQPLYESYKGDGVFAG